MALVDRAASGSMAHSHVGAPGRRHRACRSSDSRCGSDSTLAVLSAVFGGDGCGHADAAIGVSHLATSEEASRLPSGEQSGRLLRSNPPPGTCAAFPVPSFREYTGPQSIGDISHVRYAVAKSDSALCWIAFSAMQPATWLRPDCSDPVLMASGRMSRRCTRRSERCSRCSVD